MKPDPVIWQSKFFPKLLLTESHLEILRYAYPQIKKFEPLLRQAELWLHAHPERHPKKNWKKFINNWMRISLEIKEERRNGRKPEYGDAALETPNDPKLISEIINRISKNT